MGKSIYLVSDMYLPSDILSELLEEYNIRGYESIIVSCEHGCEKKNGLFNVLKKRLGNKKCIHVGDNLEADIRSAGQYGLDSFHIMSGRELLEESVQDRLLVYTDRLEHRIMLGLYIAKAYNNPFILYKSKGKLYVGKDQKPGYLFFGPFMLSFINWMIKKKQFAARNQLEYVSFCKADSVYGNEYSVFAKKCMFKFYLKKQSKEQLLWVKRLHDEILEYMRDFAKVCPKGEQIEFGCVDKVMEMIGEQYSILDSGFRELLCFFEANREFLMYQRDLYAERIQCDKFWNI